MADILSWAAASTKVRIDNPEILLEQKTESDCVNAQRAHRPERYSSGVMINRRCIPVGAKNLLKLSLLKLVLRILMA